MSHSPEYKRPAPWNYAISAWTSGIFAAICMCFWFLIFFGAKRSETPMAGAGAEAIMSLIAAAAGLVGLFAALFALVSSRSLRGEHRWTAIVLLMVNLLGIVGPAIAGRVLKRVRAASASASEARRWASPEGRLIRAAQNGNLETVKKLLAEGVSMSPPKGFFCPAWVEAVRRDDLDMVEVFIEEDARRALPAMGALQPDVVLEAAADANSENIANRMILLTNSKDLNLPRALDAAISKNNLAMARLLLENGADPNRSVKAARAFANARERQQEEMVHLLRQFGIKE